MNVPAFFIAESTALDLLNSIAAPFGITIEWLADGAALLDWYETSHLLSADELGAFRQAKTCDSIAEEARKLRDWLRTFVERHAGRPLARLGSDELLPINSILARDHGYRRIAADSESPPRWQRIRPLRSAKDLLIPLAEAIGELICELDFTLVKQCESPTCPLWFYDSSKNHSRRWCTMSVCGNRAKAAQHRAKQKKKRS